MVKFTGGSLFMRGDENMVTTRDFNASTTRQNEAVDTLLKCGFYPSKIRLNGYEVEILEKLKWTLIRY